MASERDTMTFQSAANGITPDGSGIYRHPKDRVTSRVADCYDNMIHLGGFVRFEYARAQLKEDNPELHRSIGVELHRQAWQDAKKHQRTRKPEKPAPAPEKPLAGGSLLAPDQQRRRLPGTRFIFTSAQNNTYLHEAFWNSLLHFAGATDASLHVSRFTYNKAGWRANGGVSKETLPTETVAETGVWFDPRIKPFILDEQVKVADGLVFCGELDILPTAATPLQTLSNYTGPNSGIIPHAKVQLTSLATMKHQDAKFMYTTGACTLRNYIERKAGQVATFHHVFGALLVEVDAQGKWFARQLMADDNGVFFDIDTAWGPGWSAPAKDFGDTVVTLGDIHIAKIDPQALSTAFSMLETVKPGHVFVHDLIDFEPRNHHNIKDPHFLARQHKLKRESVAEEMRQAAGFLDILISYAGKVHVVRSNHDQALERWLKDADAAADPVNAGYWHALNARIYACIDRDMDFDVFKFAIGNKNVHYVQEDESVILNDIEYGIHGHRGPNGSKGSPKAYRQLGRKANTGHTHSAGIIDGVWTAGVLGKLDMGYNSGPSSWSHSNILTYPNGKRCMITQRGNKWRA